MTDDTATLAAELAQVAPRRWWNRATVALGAAALLLGGFAGGLQVQKSWGTEDTPTARAGAFGGGQNRAGGMPNFPTAQATTAAPTTGKVKLVNGTTIYVEKPDGSVVTVKTDARTTVSTTSKAKLTDVRAGRSVTIQGSTATDGTVTASTVTTTK